MTKPHEYVDTAREVLKATGWCKGKLGDVQITTPDGDGEHCAIGSLAAARYILDGPRKLDPYGPGEARSNYRKAVNAVYNALPRDIRKKYEESLYWSTSAMFSLNAAMKVDAIVEYNDGLESRDKGKLLRVFRKASKSLQA